MFRSETTLLTQNRDQMRLHIAKEGGVMKLPHTAELMKIQKLDPQTLSNQSGIPLPILKRIVERNYIASEGHRRAIASVLGINHTEISWGLKTPQVELVSS